MLSKTILLLASAALAVASPARRQSLSCTASQPLASVPTLPVNGGVKELAGPPSGTSLKYIALGFGIQNYTCATVGGEAKAIGALAMLYDITPLYPGQGPNSLTLETFNSLTSEALWGHDVPLNFVPTTPDRVNNSPGADLVNPFTPDAPLQLEGLQPIPFLGHHLFTAAGVPQFKLNGAAGAVDFLATKIDGIDAPASADSGPEGTGPVGWLYLGAMPEAVGAQYVYRVITAGGKTHGCSSVGQDSTSYTTQYWVYA